MIKKLLVTASAAVALLSGLPAHAAGKDAPPNEPIRLVLGFAAGGSNDIVARIFAHKASDILGTPIIVENKPGANASIASEYVAKAPADGHTLLLGSASTLAINPHTVAGLRYDPLRDFVGIARVAMTPEVIAINPRVKAKTLAEFVALAKQQTVSMASSGYGGLPHLAIELLKTSADLKINHIPYKGGAPAATDTVGGHVDGIIMDLTPLQAFIKDGRLRALAVASKTRSAFLPDVPTTAELGYPRVEAVNWFAIVAPKGTPAAVADRLHTVFSQAAKDPGVMAQLGHSGIEPYTTQTRGELTAFLKSESERWKAVAAAAGVEAH